MAVVGYNAPLWWASAVFLLGACVAAPLPEPITINDRNTIVLTAILFAGIGAVLSACVCCRRRKNGFEPNNVKDRKEFENEAGMVETTRASEFPIFQALSSNNRTSSTVPSDPTTVHPQPPVRHPNIQSLVIGEGRIVPVTNQDTIEVDNNNGPISPADLENIENNNAGTYIPNQNEIAPPERPMPEQHMLHGNVDFANESLLQAQHTLPSANAPSPRSMLHSQTLYSSVDLNENTSNRSTVINMFTDRNPFLDNDEVNLNDVRIDIDEVPLLYSQERRSCPDNRTNSPPPVSMDLLKHNDIAEDDEELPNTTEVLSSTVADNLLPAEPSIIEMGWVTESTHTIGDVDPFVSDDLDDDANGVEEALFALDSVISGADDDAPDRDDVSTSDVNEDGVPFNDIILGMLRNNAPSEEHADNLNQMDQGYNELMVDICHEAKQMVDAILEESVERVLKMDRLQEPVEPCPADMLGDTIVIPKIHDTLATNDLNVLPSPEQPNDSTNSLHDLDFRHMAIAASTPFARKQIDTTDDLADSDLPTIPKASQNLFGNDPNAHESSWCAPLTSDATFDATNRDAPVQNDTFVANDHTYTEPIKPTLPAKTTNPPEIRIISDPDTVSVDLTTATPVNTPIELNYSVDGWDTFVTSSMQKPVQTTFDATYTEPAIANATAPIADATFDQSPSTSNGWFLHPTEGDNPDDLSNAIDDDDDDQIEDGLLLSLTFDSLRKQLTEALPHAQGAMSSATHDFSDDDDDDDPIAVVTNDFDVETSSAQPQAELFINYKRALSPIPEESEDESTCKTFVMNDTKCMDSTSTGNMEEETAEAMMGVNKTLMASNDTLFNFEDTLGDRDDPFSPRTTSTEPNLPLSISQSASNNSSIHESRSGNTKAGNSFLSQIEATAHGASMSADATFIQPLWENTPDIVAAEILSPDQPKTFSEETCIDLAGGGTSSDLSLTFDGTYTTTFDDKTCIMVDQMPANRTTPDAADEPSLQVVASSEHAADSTVLLESESNVECEDFPQSIDDIDVPIINQTSCENTPEACDLSGEEDPWVVPTCDIRFTGTSAEMMSTSFSTSPKDWDSDADDDSSEEFMYVKGVQTGEAVDAAMDKHPDVANNQKPNDTDEPSSSGDLRVSESEVWNAHADQVMVSTSPARNEDDEHIAENSSSSDADEEWVPSCWDSMAQPARSALKSPDKTSSEEDSSGGSGNKKRRRVVFKKQNYHSVYEYPKEMVALSPAYSEPQMHAWERSFDGRILDNKMEGCTVESGSNEMDMFMVSSSAHPFQNGGRGGLATSGGSQFHAQCHTWPTSDTEFSWSQIEEDSVNTNDQYSFPSYSDMEIKWPDNLRHFFCSEDVTDGDVINGDPTRPDSGVGESAELLTDSLGDLCHTKSSLRLNLLPSTTQFIPESPTNILKPVPELRRDEEHPPEDTHINVSEENRLSVIMPTPSCTGSMDSLSSSSGSERQISFTTFGKNSTSQSGRKTSPTMFDCNHRRSDSDSSNRIGSSLVFVDNVEIIDDASPPAELSKSVHDFIKSPVKTSFLLESTDSSGKPQNDSTDEDSGIESIMRIKSTSPSFPVTKEKNKS